MNRMGKGILCVGMLAALPAAAETVALRNGTEIRGKAVRYGEYVIVSGPGGEARVLDEILVESVRPEPASPLEVFVDLPDPGEGAEPEASKVRFFPSAKAKARFLLDLATRPGTPPETVARARAALLSMGKAAEEELFSCVVPTADPERVSLALDGLASADPKGMEKRLVEVALLARTEGTCRRAAEEIKRRYGKTPRPVLEALVDKETTFATARAAADVVAVTRDGEGIAALVTAIRTRGIRVTKAPRVPFVSGFTEIDIDPLTGKERLKPGGMVARGKDGEISLVRISWLDEEAPQIREAEPHLLHHLVVVLQEVSGEHFSSVQEILDWWDTQPQPAPPAPLKP